MIDKSFIDAIYATGGFTGPSLVDLYPQIIPRDYVIPRAMFEQMESRSYRPEIAMRDAENRIKVEKIVTSFVTVDAPPSRRTHLSGDREQMRSDIDAVELTPASRFDLVSAGIMKRLSEKIKRNMEYGFLRAARGETL